jgi:hypothetical protein
MPGVKRLLRITWNGLAAVSALLCVVTVALWVRGNSFIDSVEIVTRGAERWEFYSSAAEPRRLGIERASHWPESPRWLRNSYPAVWDPQRPVTYELPIAFTKQFGGAHSYQWHARWIWGGWGAMCVTVDGAGKVRRLTPAAVISGAEATENLSHPLPYWNISVTPAALAVATGLLPLCVGISGIGIWIRRRWRVQHCLCPACGYDLRSTPDRCPECGAMPTGK